MRDNSILPTAFAYLWMFHLFVIAATDLLILQFKSPMRKMQSRRLTFSSTHSSWSKMSTVDGFERLQRGIYIYANYEQKVLLWYAHTQFESQGNQYGRHISRYDSKAEALHQSIANGSLFSRNKVWVLTHLNIIVSFCKCKDIMTQIVAEIALSEWQTATVPSWSSYTFPDETHHRIHIALQCLRHVKPEQPERRPRREVRSSANRCWQLPL